MTTTLVTGAAGFIGYHLCKRLLEAGQTVVGIDSLDDYYDPRLKNDRLRQIEHHHHFEFLKTDVLDNRALADIFSRRKFTTVVHLAALPGARHSMAHPHASVKNNIDGFLNVLEHSRDAGIAHVIFASSSSVYGTNTSVPLSVHQGVDHPVSLYAVTKRTDELLAHVYASNYGLPCSGLRFFTVYGPWGRPDMAYYLFTKAIMEGKPIDVYNNGMMQRDCTYIDDAVEAIVRLMDLIPERNAGWDHSHPDPATSAAPFRLYNVGSNRPVELRRLIEVIETCLGKKAALRMLPLQPGDVVGTWADVADLTDALGLGPRITLEEGLKSFVQWYRDYHGIH